MLARKAKSLEVPGSAVTTTNLRQGCICFCIISVLSIAMSQEDTSQPCCQGGFAANQSSGCWTPWHKHEHLTAAEQISKGGGAAHLTQIYFQCSLSHPCCTAGWAHVCAGAVGVCVSFLGVVEFCPVAFEGLLYLSFPKKGKHGSGTPAHMVTASHHCALPYTCVASSSALWV